MSNISFYERHFPLGKYAYNQINPEMHKRIQISLLEEFLQRESLLELLCQNSHGIESAESNKYYIRFEQTSDLINDEFEDKNNPKQKLLEFAICTDVKLLRKEDLVKFQAKDSVRFLANGNRYLDFYENPRDMLNQPVILYFPNPGINKLYHEKQYREISQSEAKQIEEFCKEFIPKSNWNGDRLTEGEYFGFITGKVIPFKVHTKVIKNLDHISQTLDFIEKVVRAK